MQEKKTPEREDEHVEVRHTISAEETFTLAKDIYDLRCLIKSVYDNRAQIGRRLNFLTTIVSLVFTLLYVAYMIFSGLYSKLGLGLNIALYVILGIYGVIAILLLIFTLISNGSDKATTKKAQKYSLTLKILRYISRIAALAMGITAVAASLVSGSKDSLSVALDTMALIISIILIVISGVSLLLGGIGGIARWLLSPAKVKRTFSFVALEWYDLAITRSGKLNSTRKVDAKYAEAIGRCIDSILIPAMGKKPVQNVNISHICAAIERAPEEDRALTEGTLKNIFAYAAECGYVTFNPCKDIALEGSIEQEEKPKKEPWTVRLGKRLGKSIFNKFFSFGKKKEEDEDQQQE